jgi:hypothetical protein
MMLKGLPIALVALILWSSGVIAEVTVSSDTQLLEIGKRIYREGILSSGQALEGHSIGDITLLGAQAACVNCHRRSGMGSSEAGQRALPVTGRALYQTGPPGFWYLHELSQMNVNRFRPGYTDITLAKAIREGITPTERSLQSVMPRFNLGDADLNALIAYLKSLSDVSPAVDTNTIHWATIVTPDADPVERKAMLDVMEAFFKAKNVQTNLYLRNGHIPLNRGYAPLRNWDLQVWELQGAPETWGAQLTSNFQKNPVFAVLAGVGGRQWQPIHSFCESQKVACLFPNTNVPPVNQDDFYSVYFSKGLTLEAEALAEYLRTNQANQKARIVQVYREGSQGEVPAEAFRQANGLAKLNVHKVAANEKIDLTFWQRLIKTKRPDTLVLWLQEDDLASLKLSGTVPRDVYLSGHLLKGQLPLALTLFSNKVYLVSPWGSQQFKNDRFARVRLWLDANHLAVTDELLQGNVLWLLWLVDEAVEQITQHYSQDYLIERVEDMMGSFSNSSMYPRISLGPGQRFAAKGCYIQSVGTNGILQPLGNPIMLP